MSFVWNFPKRCYSSVLNFSLMLVIVTQISFLKAAFEEIQANAKKPKKSLFLFSLTKLSFKNTQITSMGSIYYINLLTKQQDVEFQSQHCHSSTIVSISAHTAASVYSPLPRVLPEQPPPCNATFDQSTFNSRYNRNRNRTKMKARFECVHCCALLFMR